tara:strand:- start:1738 stop:3168 length:1431 start_codon:yes stop_codon:yes gene_type:complete
MAEQTQLGLLGNLGNQISNLGIPGQLGLLSTGLSLLENRPLGESIRTGLGAFGGLQQINQQQKQREGIEALKKRYANNPRILALIDANPSGAISALTSQAFAPTSNFRILTQAEKEKFGIKGDGVFQLNVGTGQIQPVTGSTTTGSTATTAFQTLEQRAKAAGFEKGSDEYKAFMLAGGRDDSLSQTEMFLLSQRPDLLEKYFQKKFGEDEPSTNQEQPLATREENQDATPLGKQIKFVTPVLGNPEQEEITYTDGTKEIRPKVGTKAFEDRTKKRAKAFVQFNNIDDRFKLILDQIAEAENIINNQTTFDPVTGNTGVLKSNIRGSNAYKLKTILNSITAKLGFQELKGLKMEGSTLGQVTEQEFKNLSTAIVALEQGLKAEDLIDNFNQLRGVLDSSTDTIKESLLIEHPTLSERLGADMMPTDQSDKIDLPNPTTITREELAQIIGDDFSGLNRIKDSDLRIIQGRILKGTLR